MLYFIEDLLDAENPALTDRGDGWEVFKIWCLVEFTDFAFCCAGFPQSKNTTLSHYLFTISIIWSVKSCHPHLACEFGLLSSTVREAFKSNTPCSAQCERSPWEGILKLSFWSLARFLYMFFKEGGGGTGFKTLKHSPCACPGWW